jgi:hypothetical protein
MSERSHKGPQHRHRRNTPRLALVWLLTLLLALGVMAISAAAAGCPTTVTTTLSGESKEGEAITVLEGSAVKDQTTLSGFNTGKAGGTVTYSVYSDSACKTLVTKAGEVTVSSGKVPASSEEKLKAGAYYWQASYSGDSNNQAGSSTCGKEVLTVKTTTSTATTLSGESKEGEAITVLEGSAVKDQATLSGANVGSAGGTVTYAVYSDKECKILVAKAGEVTVSSGKVPASSEEKLTAGASYFWQATYSGDSNNLGSTSTCGKEVATVEAKTSLKTSLSNGQSKGAKIETSNEFAVSDTATLGGTAASTATGTVTYYIYSDEACKTLVAEAGKVSVTSGTVPSSNAETLPAGISYWQAVYSGDSFNQGSSSTCGSEISVSKASAQITTSLSGEEQSGTKVEVTEGNAVTDTAMLLGTNAFKATGTVKYNIYSDEECETLVAKAGEVTVKGESVPASSAEKLSPGTYYWQATYSGDSNNEASPEPCGEEIAVVETAMSLSTSLSGEEHSGEKISVAESAAITDQATLSGVNKSKATGNVDYDVYSDEGCKDLVAEAGDVAVKGGSVSASSEEKLPPGTYYWQAVYFGDGLNHESASTCGSEIAVVRATTSLKTTLSGAGQSGAEISVLVGTGISDQATLSGTNALKATGTIKYAIYSDKECKTLAAKAGEVTVAGGSAPESSQEKLSHGTYYWKASYSGDSNNLESASSCGAETAIVKATLLKTTLSGEKHSGEKIQVVDGPVRDAAELDGETAFMATGQVKYDVYSDKECKTLVAKAGEVTVTAGLVPASSEETLPAGTYYWQTNYSGDSHNEGSTAPCGEEVAIVGPAPPEVEQVDLTNDMPVIVDDQNGMEPESPEAIEEFTGHNKVQWEYSPKPGELTKSWPVAYVQGTTPELKARFALPAETKQMILEKRIEGKPVIKGQTVLDGESIAFTKEFAKVEELEAQAKAHEGYIELESSSGSPIVANKPLPERVGYESMTIKWAWEIKIKGESSTDSQSLGSSTLDLFLTYAKPPTPACQTVAEAEAAATELAEAEKEGTCTPIYFTMLESIATNVEQVRPPEKAIIDAAWRVFGKTGNEFPLRQDDPWRVTFPGILVPGVRSIWYALNPRPGSGPRGSWIPARWWYRYYGAVQPGRTAAAPVNRVGCGTFVKLYKDGVGRCGAWAEALMVSLRAMGANSAELIHLVVNFGASPQPCNENEPMVCIMLVKWWNFNPRTPYSGDPNFPFLATSVLDLLGAAGQGNENPPPYFWDHAITKAGTGLSAALFDPSYGTGSFPTATEVTEIEARTRTQPTQEGVLKQYQEASMAGFCRPVTLGMPNKLPQRCQIKAVGRLALRAVKALAIGGGRYTFVPRPTGWWP